MNDLSVASKPEKSIYNALQRLGYKEGRDFIFQSSQAGGRQAKGGVILDFEIPGLNIGINIQGVYWHYQTIEQVANTVLQRSLIEGMDIRLIYIDEEAALENPDYYVKEALAGVSHARMR